LQATEEGRSAPAERAQGPYLADCANEPGFPAPAAGPGVPKAASGAVHWLWIVGAAAVALVVGVLLLLPKRETPETPRAEWGPDPGLAAAPAHRPDEPRSSIPSKEPEAPGELRWWGPRKGATPSRISFSPDGKRVIGISPEGHKAEWASGTGELLSERKPPEMGKHLVKAVSPDGSRCLTLLRPAVNRLGELHVWDLEKGNIVRRWREPDGEWFILSPQAAFSPDSKSVLAVYHQQSGLRFQPGGGLSGGPGRDECFVWDCGSGAELRKIQGVKGPICLSPDGGRLFASTEFGSLACWDTRTGERARVFTGSLDPRTSLAVYEDGGSVLASVSRDAGYPLLLWKTGTEGPPKALSGHQGNVFAMAFSPDGRRILTGASGSMVKKGDKYEHQKTDQTVRLWDAISGKQLHVFKGHAEGVWAVAFSPDGKLAVSASPDSIRLWRLPQ
jgi:WD40 repeat protein